MSTSTDVLIIGGGIVGAATDYHLSRRGAKVILLESDRLASGATGRNLGYIWLHTRRKGPELDLAMATRNELEGLPDYRALSHATYERAIRQTVRSSLRRAVRTHRGRAETTARTGGGGGLGRGHPLPLP